MAIANEDPTGMSARMLELTIPNSAQVCAMAVQIDGTWKETAAYWFVTFLDWNSTYS